MKISSICYMLILGGLLICAQMPAQAAEETNYICYADLFMQNSTGVQSGINVGQLNFVSGKTLQLTDVDGYIWQLRLTQRQVASDLVQTLEVRTPFDTQPEAPIINYSPLASEVIGVNIDTSNLKVFVYCKLRK